MSERNSKQDQNCPQASDDGVDRRGFLKCMAWVGTGVIWSVSNSGVIASRAFGAEAQSSSTRGGSFTFAQISDSHVGFSHDPNKDVVATLKMAIDRVNAMPVRPDLMLHTGDLSHLSKADEFDTVDQLVKGAKVEKTFYVPGEHDFFTDDGKQYLERYGRGTRGTGWQSFDHKGVRFVGLVNVANLKPGGLGTLGQEQIAWLDKDLQGVGDSTPIVVYAHVPLWAVYPKWGWATEDSEQALALMRRFASVTVLNGHIHQILQKTEGNITFHTARSTSFPQPAPGTAAGPKPLKGVAAEKLKSMLGLASLNYMENHGSLAVVDASLE